MKTIKLKTFTVRVLPEDFEPAIGPIFTALCRYCDEHDLRNEYESGYSFDREKYFKIHKTGEIFDLHSITIEGTHYGSTLSERALRKQRGCKIELIMIQNLNTVT
jgi:hypothetical protein